LWESEEDHDRYCEDVLPDLRTEVMQMGGFPDSLVGFSIPLEPSWNIL
jgi:hypothetical protein